MLAVGLEDEAAAQAMGQLALHLRNFPKNFDKAVVSAMNKAGNFGRSESVKVLAKRYWAQRQKIKQRITVKKAKNITEGATVKGRGRPMTLGSFKMRPISVTDSRGARHTGVMGAVLKSSSLETIKGGFYGKGMAFKRKGNKAYPIQAIYGPTVVGFLGDLQHLTPVGDKSRDNFKEQLYKSALVQLRKLGLAL